MSAIPVRRDTLHPFSPRLSFKILGLSLAFMLLLGLIAQAQAAQVTLAWDANSEPDLSGYKLYYGTSPGNYATPITLGIVTTYTVTNLTDGVTYYFALTAFDTEGFESGKSNEVSYTPSASQFTLTVSKSGTGTGTVTGTGIELRHRLQRSLQCRNLGEPHGRGRGQLHLHRLDRGLQRNHQSLHRHHECRGNGDGRLRS